MVLVGCSSWWCSTPAVGWRWRRRLARMHSKDPLEEIAGGWRRSRKSTGHSRALPTHFALRIRLWFDIGRCIRAGHLRRGSLRIACVFFVVASEVASRVVISHCFDQLERIGLMCGCEPGDLHIELSFILRERAFENACSDRSCDLAAVARRTLHHHCDDILRMVKRRETRKPRHVLLVATVGGLGSAGFPRYHPIFQTRAAAGSSIFVNNFPKTFTHKLNLFR